MENNQELQIVKTKLQPRNTEEYLLQRTIKLEEEVETWRTAYFNLQNQMNQASRRIEELIAQNEAKSQKQPKAQ